VPGYAATLAALDDGHLALLLGRRPDLLAGSLPATFAQLASRAGSPPSLAAALRSLDRGALQLAELLAVVGLPTTVAALAAAAGPGLDPQALRRGLGELAGLGLALTGPDGTLSGPRGLGAPFGDPGQLGPSVAELAKIGVTRNQLERIAWRLGLQAGRLTHKAALVTAVTAALTDPEVIARAAAEADEPARRLLDHALAAGAPIVVMGVADGRFATHPDAEPARWLLDHGLLLPTSYSQFVVPREARIGLRGGLVFPRWPSLPSLEPLDPLPDLAERAGAAARRLVLAAEGLLGRLDRDPLPLTQAGTVAVRDLRRLGRELHLPEDEAGLLADLLVEAGLLAVGGPWDHRTLGLRPEADAWLAGPRATRWADLAVAWRERDLGFEDHLAARRSAAERVRALGGNRRSAATARRRGLLEALAGVPEGRSVAVDTLADLLAWRRPLVWPDPSGPGAHRQVTHLVVDLAELLGLAVTADGRVAAGPAGGPWAAGAGAAELAAAMAGALPEGSDRLLVAGDLTVVAPDGLAPGVESRLALLADREPGGAWRIHEPSLRRALDEGLSAGDVLDFLRERSATPLPQALEYLVGDAARRHGRLRVGGASTYLRGDPALVAGVVRSAAGRRLGLRELAPGVAVTQRSQRDLLAALRRAGEAPLAEEADGSPRLESRKAVRHQGRPLPGDLGATPPPAAVAEPGELVARLRAAASSGGNGGAAAAGNALTGRASPATPLDLPLDLEEVWRG
jgi:Helicase conserved C-terminal domain